MIRTAQQSAESRELDEALQDTFPASDPPSMTTPIAATPSEQFLHQGTAGEVRLYRVIDARDAAEPFAPNTAGGRWTHPGTPCVYASLSPAAALLEYLVHLEGRTPEKLMLAVGAIRTADVLAETNPPSLCAFRTSATPGCARAARWRCACRARPAWTRATCCSIRSIRRSPRCSWSRCGR